MKMKARHCRAWLAGLRSHWAQAHPPCAEPDCTLWRRLWRRMGWWHGRIRLRGSSYCAPKCFENAAREYFSAACTAVVALSPVRHRIPLGLLMLSRGQLTYPQLQAALEAQQGPRHQRIGEWLQELGFASEPQITSALGLQWACPVLAWRTPHDSGCGRLLPFRLLEHFRMLPVQFVAATRIFYVAFCDGIDYTALYAIEQMLDCRTEACLISRSSMDRELERMGHEARAGDLLFESWHDPQTMAHITCGYALKLGAEQVRMVACGQYIWVRLEARHEVSTLLFRHPLAAPHLADLDRENQSVARRVVG
jgi:hypothetical protein